MYLSLIFAGIYISGCAKDSAHNPKEVGDFNHEVIKEWNETFLQVERYSAGYRPGPAPRGLAYLGIAAYEACVAGMPEYQSLSGHIDGLSIPEADPELEYNWPLVVNESYNYLMPLFFSQATSNQLSNIEQTYDKILQENSAGVSQDIITRSKERGEQVAELIWIWAKSDNIGHEHYLDPFQGYNWVDHYKKDGNWIPTTPGPGKPMGGVWGRARAFTLKSQAEKICIPPIPFSESPQSEFYSQALEVYAQNTPTLSYEKEWIGEYWSDDLLNLTFSPGPRWMAIGIQVLELENSNLEDAIVMAAKVGMALNDAAIACWASKYHYNLERPVSYIQRVIDPNWKTSLYNPLTNEENNTPSFPAYPSGHSTMGGAAAEALASLFGYNYSMADKCHIGRTEFSGEPRNFPSFAAMAQENAWSRVPLGVHFRMDSEVGVNFGFEIGRKVNKLPWKK